MEDPAKQNDRTATAQTENKGDVIFSGEITGDRDVRSVLSLVAQRRDVSLGLLRILSKELAGQITISEGKSITNANVPKLGLSGQAALQQLLQAKAGLYVYSQPDGDAIGTAQRTINVDIMDLLAMSDSDKPEPPGESPGQWQTTNFDPQAISSNQPTLGSESASGSNAKAWSLEDLNSIPTPKPTAEVPLPNPEQGGEKVVSDIEKSLERHRQTLKMPKLSAQAPPPPPTQQPAPPPTTRRTTSTHRTVSQEHSKELNRLVSSKQSTLTPKEFVNASSTRPAVNSLRGTDTNRTGEMVAWAAGALGIAISIMLATQLYGAVDGKKSMQKGLQDLKQGKNSEAYFDFSQALNSDKELKSAYLYRAIAASRMREFDKAISDYSEVIRMAPSAVAFTGRACVYLKKKDYEAANKDCEQALALDSNYADAYRVKAAINAKLHEYHQAIIDSNFYLRKARKTADKAELSEALSTRALSYLKVKKYDQAIDDYTEAIALDDKNGYLYASRAAAFQGVNNWQRALEDCNKAIPLIDTPSSMYPLRALCYAAMRQNSRSIADLDRAILSQPNSLELHRMRGKAKLATGDFRGAMDDFQFVLSHNPNDKETQARYDQASRNLPHGISPAFLRAMLADNASSSATSSAVIKGTPEQLVKIGYQQLQAGEASEAVATLSAAVKASPNNAQARRYLAYAFNASGDHSSAVAQFRALESMGQLSTADLLIFGQALEASGAREAAISILNKLLAANPGDAKARLLLIELYKKASFDDRARAVASDGIARAQSTSEKAAYLDKLKNTGPEAARGNGTPTGPTHNTRSE